MNGNNIDTLIRFAKEIRVLYIEESLKDRDEALGVFRIFFDNIHIATDGQEGYESFQKNKYDLIITGIDIPKIDGIELISKIRDISKQVTILVISSSTQEKNFVNLIKSGIDGYIIKPIEVDQFITVLQKTVEKLHNKHELFQYRVSLENRVEEELQKRLNSEKILAYQSKLASMGEMLDVIAHQWTQPINIMNMHVDFLQYQYKDGKLDLEAIKDFQRKFNDQKNHILETLEEFRDFFRPDKTKENFTIADCINSVLLLIQDEFIKHNIKIDVDIQNDFEIFAVQNEFKHIILNILNNAKDEFIQKDIDQRIIRLSAYNCDIKNKKVIDIKDNAGGIPKNIIGDIFKSNVTSKSEGKGTGMGLYMCHQIIEKNDGMIWATNVVDGAKFTIELN